MDVPAHADLMRIRRLDPGNVGLAGRDTNTSGHYFDSTPQMETVAVLNDGCAAGLRHTRSGLGALAAQHLRQGHKQDHFLHGGRPPANQPIILSSWVR